LNASREKGHEMALRDQPYIPLYVQDFLSDEKLRECKAASVGVYILMMCLMHKSEEYGVILLKQNSQQNTSTCLDFAYKLAKHLPYAITEIDDALKDLIENKVIHLEGNKILQRRMVRDNRLSLIRSEAGKQGVFAKANAIAKHQANTEYEYVNENESVNDNVIEVNVDNKPINDDINSDNVKPSDNLAVSIECPAQEIVDLWNKTIIDLPKVRELTDKRRKAIRTIWLKHGMTKDIFETAFKDVQESDFLCGRTTAQWTGCGFDWILTQGNWTKVIEGNYKNKANGGNKQMSMQEPVKYPRL
jgi:hypothetical protein